MGRASGDQRAAQSGGRRGSEQDRIIQRFKRLGPQRKALLLALRPFVDDEGHIDAERWDSAFSSGDPETIVQVVAVTGSFQMLVNHYVEMLHAGARLAGLPVARGDTAPSARVVIAAVRDDKGISSNQAEVVVRLNHIRNELQHASPGVQADAAREDIELLIKTLPRLVDSYLKWLVRYDVHLLPRK